MKVHVDRKICESSGVCMGFCPDIFDLDEEDVPAIPDGDVPREAAELVRLSVKLCPRQALTIEE